MPNGVLVSETEFIPRSPDCSQALNHQGLCVRTTLDLERLTGDTVPESRKKSILHNRFADTVYSAVAFTNQSIFVVPDLHFI